MVPPLKSDKGKCDVVEEEELHCLCLLLTEMKRLSLHLTSFYLTVVVVFFLHINFSLPLKIKSNVLSYNKTI